MDIEKASMKSAINNIKITGSLSNVDPDAIAFLAKKAAAALLKQCFGFITGPLYHTRDGPSTNSKHVHVCFWAELDFDVFCHAASSSLSNTGTLHRKLEESVSP